MNDSHTTSPVFRLLNPASIAIVGMSSKAGSSGRTILGHLRRNGYRGAIHLVGRSGGEIDGITVLRSIDELPDSVDVALLVVPGAAVRDAVEGCARAQVGVAVLYASGFAEMGDAGREEQAAITELARSSGLRLVGPNCIGYTNYVDPLNTVFLPDAPVVKLEADCRSAIAVLTQSGGLLSLMHQGLTGRGLKVSYRIASGNEADLTLAEYLRFFADDDATRLIMIYAEDIRDPQAFLDALRVVRDNGKAVTLMHSGRSVRARNAAASHTGAMSADWDLMETMVTRAGACVARTLEELMDVSEILVRFPVPPVAPLAVATTSGAFCAIALDTIADSDTEAAPLADETVDVLTRRLPSYVTAHNPLDLSTAVVADPGLFHDCVAALLNDDGIGSVALAVPFVDAGQNREMLEQVTRAAEGGTKPVVIGMFGDTQPIPEDLRTYAAEHSMILTMNPERAIRALATVTRFGQASRRPVASPDPHRRTIADGGSRSGPLVEWQSKKLFRSIDIPVPAGRLATSVEEAVGVASEIGYPVVAKAQSPNLLHKTESKGIVLDIQDEAALRVSFEELTSRLPDLDGVLVESMSEKGLELMVGASRHPLWGPVVLVGLGGVWVEALGDVRMIPADLSEADIISELFELRSAKLLGKFRGSAEIDTHAVAQVVRRVRQLMIDEPRIVELDVNPLLCTSEGATALDALVVYSSVGDER